MRKSPNFVNLWGRNRIHTGPPNEDLMESPEKQTEKPKKGEDTAHREQEKKISSKDQKHKRSELLQSINTSMFISSFTLLLYNVVKDVENWYVLVLGMSSTVILSQAIVSFVWPQWENICYPLSWAAISIAAIQTTFFLQEFYFCR